MMNNLKNEVLSYDRYVNYQIQIIDEGGNDHFVRDLLSYDKWINVWQNYPNVKVEGLDDQNYHENLIDKRVNSNHLFINNKGGFSFKEHKDDTNVYLYVVKGKKKIHMNGKISLLKQNEGVIIPKGVYHKVDSEPDTWALSIGYFDE